MIVMYYAGAQFEIPAEARAGLEEAAKRAANAGEFIWLQLGPDGDPKTARFLAGPAIPIAFVWEPDTVDGAAAEM